MMDKNKPMFPWEENEENTTTNEELTPEQKYNGAIKREAEAAYVYFEKQEKRKQAIEQLKMLFEINGLNPEGLQYL